MKGYPIEFIRETLHYGEICNSYHLVYRGNKSYKQAESKFYELCKQYPTEKIALSFFDTKQDIATNDILTF